jgi:crotonobetainyl-CoA:carnitine CoA-transferase CaiB-like acyl-CoA transferase
MEQTGKGVGPCAGLKVIELGTSMVSGPFCGQLLGDLGADVVKIENAQGDPMRVLPPLHQRLSGQFLQFNRNKRSVVLDFKQAPDREAALRLISQTDVVIENFRPGVTKRLGLDYETVKASNERLIYVSINGFGSDGPYAKLPAYDQVIQGITGFMPFQGSEEQPSAIRSVVVDKITALSAATAILAAVVHRERGGRGQRVEVKMLDAFAAFILPEYLAAHTFPEQPPGNYPPAGIYKTLRTQDGHLVGLIAQDSQFAGICRALGREELLSDERFTTTVKRYAAMDQLLAELEQVTLLKSTRELLEILWAQAEVAIAPVNSLSGFLNDPQVLHNRTSFCSIDPELGSIRQLGPFATFGATPLNSFKRAPHLGEHTDQVLQEAQGGEGPR